MPVLPGRVFLAGLHGEKRGERLLFTDPLALHSGRWAAKATRGYPAALTEEKAVRHPCFRQAIEQQRQCIREH